MWEEFLNFGEGLIESVGEGVTQVIDGKIDLEISRHQEQAKDPEELKAVEPIKGTATDGSTIVGQTPQNAAAQRSMAMPDTIMGFDKQTVFIGGGVLTALVISVALIVRGGR